MSGSVVTFYSYKGGVGRSFLLANVAVLLAKWGYRVLCVDWDVEAPGLDEYFRPWLGTQGKPGLVELVTDFVGNKGVDWRRYISHVHLPNSPGPLALMHSGVPDAGFVGRVQSIDWRHLYDDLRFGQFLEKVREEWKESYDLVLVDSRTGVTDIGGICTVHLPDILVFLFTANQQSLAGVTNIVRLAIEQRSRLPLNRAGLLTLPIPARFDARGQESLAQKWLQTFAETLEPFYDAWLDADLTTRRILDLTRLPYFSVWTFGERLAVLEERDSDAESVSYYLATIAALIARQLSDSDLLARSRDAYVEGARSEGSAALARRSEPGASSARSEFMFDFYVSHSRESFVLGRRIADSLERVGGRVFFNADASSAETSRSTIVEAITRSRHFVLVSTGVLSPWQLGEFASFVEIAGADEQRKTVLIGPQRANPLVSGVLASRGIGTVVWWDPTQEQVPNGLLVTRTEAEVGHTAQGAIPESLRQLADQYLHVEIADYEARVARKNALALDLGLAAQQSLVAHDALAAAGHDGLTVALVDAARRSPEPGDLERLLRVGPTVKSLHAAFRLLVASVDLAERVHLRTEQRAELLKLCDAYEGMAHTRGDLPLATLVSTTRRRLEKLS